MKVKTHGSNITEVIFSNGRSCLFSYETPVAAYIPGEGFFKTNYSWSSTTSRHVNKWLKQVGTGHAKLMDQSWFDQFADNN